MENKTNLNSILSMLTACMGRLMSVAAFGWFAASVAEAGEPASFRLHPLAVAASGLVLFAVGLLLMKKERTFLRLLILDGVCALAISALDVLILSGGWTGGAFTFAGLLLFAYFHIKWQADGVTNASLQVNLAVIMGEILLCIFTVDYYGTAGVWQLWLMIFAGMTLMGAVLFKQGGLRTGGSEIRGAGLTVLSAGLVGGLFFGAKRCTPALGKFLSGAWSVIVFCLKWLLKIIRDFFTWLAALFPPTVGTGEEQPPFQEVEIPEIEFVEMSEMDKWILIIGTGLAVTALIVWTIAAAIRYLKRRRTKISPMERVKTREDRNSFRNLLNLLKKAVRRLRNRMTLMIHPNSVAAALVRLENRLKLSPSLHRREGETPREFTERAAAASDAPEERDRLLRLADAVDRAAYAPGGSWLENFR